MGEKSLLGSGVAEDVEDAGGGRYRRTADRRLDPAAQLVLGEELLERPLAGNNAVAAEVARDRAGLPVEAGGNDEHLLRQLPRGAEGDCSFLGVLDDVHHIAEIDDIGGAPVFVGEERGVPAGHGYSHLVEPLQVTAAAASVVEERGFRGEQAVFEREGDGAGQGPPLDGGLVGGGSTHLPKNVLRDGRSGSLPRRSPGPETRRTPR